MGDPARLAVFVSGGGTNLQALLDRFNRPGAHPARVALVLSDRAGAGGLERARRAGVPARVVPPEEGSRIEGALRDEAIDWAVLAGYLRLLPSGVIRSLSGRVLNLHPALLPSFGGAGMYGRRVHEAVLSAGVALSGATVHLVDETYDTGPIVAQWPVPVLPGDTAGRLAERVQAVEHRLLPAVVERLVREGMPPSAPFHFLPGDAPPGVDALAHALPVPRRADTPPVRPCPPPS